MFGKNSQIILQAKCTLILLMFVVPVAVQTPEQAVKETCSPRKHCRNIVSYFEIKDHPQCLTRCLVPWIEVNKMIQVLHSLAFLCDDLALSVPCFPFQYCRCSVGC